MSRAESPCLKSIELARKRSLLILLLAGLLPAAQAAAQPVQAPKVLEIGKAIEREMAGEQKHGYQIALAEGKYAFVVIEQRGIDVFAQLLGTDDKLIAGFDFEVRNQGQERIGFVAETAGAYHLLVQGKNPKLPPGRYVIRLVEVRDATEKDRWLHESARLRTESARLADAGKYDEALPLAEKTLELRERLFGAESPLLVHNIRHLAFLSLRKEEYAKAAALYQRGLAIAEKSMGPEHPLVAQFLTNLADTLAAKGEDSRTVPLYQRALSILEKNFGPDHPQIPHNLHQLGKAYLNMGDFVQAEPLFQRSLMMSEKTLGEDHSEVASSLNYLAILYSDKGDYAKAEALVQRSLTIAEKRFGPDHPFVATVLNNFANLYRETGDYDRAELLYRRALAIKEKALGPDSADAACTAGNLAFIYYARGDYAKAEALHLRTLAIREKTLGPNHPMVGLNLSDLANLYIATGEYERVGPLFQRALSIYEAAYGTNYHNLAHILVDLARLSAAEGKPAEAVAFQARANAIIEHNVGLNLVIGSERQKLAYLATLPEQADLAISLHIRFANDEQAARDLAALTVLQHKGRVQDALSNSLGSLRARFSPEDQALLDRLNIISSRLARFVLSEPKCGTLVEHQKEIKTLEEERESLESEIGRRSVEFSSQSQPVTLAAIRSSIPDDAALIELVTYRPFDPKAKASKPASGEPRYAAYIIRKKGEAQWKELGIARAIDEAIDNLRNALRDPKRRDAKQLARALDEKLMQPIRPLLGDATRLLISPDGQLNLIPFEALVDEQDRYLVERFSFTYLTSGRDLMRLQVARESKSPPMVFANPLFGEPDLTAMAKAGGSKSQRAGKRQSLTTGSDLSNVYFAPLAGTAAEAQAIKSLFAEAVVLTGPQAAESSFKRVSAPQIIHIATHGFFLTDAPAPPSNANGERTRAISATAKIENPLLRSGLALAGANLHKDGEDDGILTALEASGLNLWGTKLVTLSACDTGLGEVKNGEGVYGLRRALVLAGTESLVMSLWPVSDYATRELMTAYYKGLKAGQGRGDALRQVQLEMLKRKDRQHPFYWASFIQSGEWANLDGKR